MVIIDTGAPGETIAITQVSNDTGVSSSDFITSVNSLIITGNLSSPLLAGEHVELSLDGGMTWLIATVSGTTWSYDNSANALPDNSYALQARVIDVAGNVGQIASQTLQIDSVAQHALINITSMSPDSGISSIDYVTNGTKLTFFGTLNGPLGTGESVRLSLDNGLTWNQAIVTGTHWEYDPLLDGAYHVIAQVIDLAGNIGNFSSIDIIVDNTTPVINPGTDVAPNLNGSLSISGVPGTADPGSTVTVVFNDGSIGHGVVMADGSYGPITSTSPQTTGTTNVTLTDIAGNVSTQAIFTYVDITAPVAPATPVVVVNPDGTLGFFGGPGAAEPGSVITITFPDNTIGTGVVNPNGSYGPIISAGPQTSGTVTTVVTDPAGNASSPVTNTYVDTTPPVAPNPPVVVSNPDGTLSISGGPGAAEPGSNIHVTFPDGTTGNSVVNPNGSYGPVISTGPQTSGTVTAVVTDPAGNISPPVTSTYADITAPVAPATPVVVVNPDGTLGFFGGPGAAEPGSVITITFPDNTIGTGVVNPNGSYGPVISTGPQTSGTVTAVVTDPAGNISPPVTSTYADVTAPVAPATPVVVVNPDGTLSLSGGTGAAEPGSVITITFPDNTIGTGVVNPNGSYGPIISAGPQTSGTVTAVVTDPAGNTSPPVTSTYADVTAPVAPATPVVVVNPDGTLAFSGGPGAAEPGSVITITFPDNTIGTGVVNPNGSYGPIISAGPQTSGTVTAVVTDPAGNTSPPVTSTYADVTAPVVPTTPMVVVNPDGTLSLSGGPGAAEPGSVITITFPDNTIGTGVVNPNGSYGPITSATPQSYGTITAVTTDPAGNTSPPVTSPYTDTTPPVAPATPVVVVNPDGTLAFSGGPGAAERSEEHTSELQSRL